MARIELAKAEMMVAELPGWELHDSTIRRVFLFAGFPEAVAFVVRLAFEAESADQIGRAHV